MSDQMMVCNHGGSCMVTRCLHNGKHVKTDSCSNDCNGRFCVESGLQTTAKPAKPTRKRSAPLYGDLLNELELLKMNNHNLSVENDRLRDSLNAYRLASLFGIVALWFRNRKGVWK